jgi:hypothetical protein
MTSCSRTERKSTHVTHCSRIPAAYGARSSFALDTSYQCEDSRLGLTALRSCLSMSCVNGGVIP